MQLNLNWHGFLTNKPVKTRLIANRFLKIAEDKILIPQKRENKIKLSGAKGIELIITKLTNKIYL